MDKKLVYSSVGVALALLLLVFTFLPCFSFKYENLAGDDADVRISGFDAIRAFFAEGDAAAKLDKANELFAENPNSALAVLLELKGIYLSFVEGDDMGNPDFADPNAFNKVISALAMTTLMLMVFSIISLIVGVLSVFMSRKVLPNLIYLVAMVITGVLALGVLIISIIAATGADMGILAWSIILGILGVASAALPFVAMKFKACVVKESMAIN